MNKKINKYLFRSVIALCAAGTLFLAGFALLRPGVFSHPVDLFVMAGQSNMQGFKGDAAQYPDDPEGLDSGIPFYWYTPQYSSSNGEWTKLKPQGGIFKDGHFGPEVTFARRLLKDGCSPAIFKYSLGGTSLAKNWRAPGENGMYDKMVKELSHAVSLLEEKGYIVNVRAFVWIQGETDAKSKDNAEKYGFRLEAMLNDLRANVLHNKKLLVILGVDEQHPAVIRNPEVLQYHKHYAKYNPFTVFTSMLGLEKADRTHLTPAALQEHGDRLFNAVSGILDCDSHAVDSYGQK